MQHVVKLLPVLLLLCPSAPWCQTEPAPGVTTTRFIEQGQVIGQYQQFLCVICNPSAQSLALNSGLVYQAAQSWNIAMVGYERVAQEEAKQTGPSVGRWIGRGAQWGSIAFTVADQAKLWKIGTDQEPARWKGVILVAGVALGAVMDWIARHPVQSELPPPAERLPPAFTVPGAIGGVPGCVQYPIYGMVTQ